MPRIKIVTDHERFLTTRVIGNIAKEVVRGLLDEAGYRTYPYGYESFLSEIKYRTRRRGSDDTDSMKRVRSHPDLVVYDHESEDIRIVEVKYRSSFSESYGERYVGIKAKSVELYHEYWNDSVLVVVVPTGKTFYAQNIADLPLPKPDEHPLDPEILVPRTFIDFNLDKQLRPIAEFFPRVAENQIYEQYANLVKGISKIEQPKSVVVESE